MELYIFDSDGNAIGDAHEDMEDALRAACVLVTESWPCWERATISYVPPSHCDLLPAPVVTIERDGPRGTKRVRVILADAGWVRFTFGDR